MHGRHSPVDYGSQNSHRNHDYHYEDQCITNKSHSDMTSNHGNNCHNDWLFITGRHNPQSSQPIPPDRFLSRSHLIEAAFCPAALKADGEWGKLSWHIYTKFRSNQQTQETFRDKMILWKKLYIFIRANFPGFGLYLVGSTMSGFGSNDSDVDMCLLVRHTEMEQRKEAILYLGQISKVLKNCGFVKRVELIQAKVPILKFESLGLEVDLNCNNAVGIRNTHLLYCYSQMDWRVRPLVLIVKLWAARQDINDAKNSTISSYSLSLMVIHYLQCGVSPPVLPCLQEMYKDKFSPHSDISQIDLHEELYPYFSKNKQSLGELLVGFLQYYVEFDYFKYAISIRKAARLEIEDCRLVRNSKNDPHQWKYLCIEEPFDLTNTARSVYDYLAFRRIHKIFCKSYEKLKETRCLDSIFMPIY
ncbi:UNVERIFIED_CONTAM: hypothetical protein PYX00_008050 [Menopon gallinae]|uniref:PAP-associated domain-containing protein n=1 Tax=Menopon gallinae TaxID=328185 RepID=A0AAW2HLP1_9NEOP